MSRQKALRDELWRLAKTGDAAALRRAGDVLEGYDAHRARAFALALRGRGDDAVAQLEEGAADGWPFPAALAADRARVRFLAGDYQRSLAALEPAVHAADRVDPATADLAADIAAREPALRLRAVRLVLGGGTTWQRLRNAAAAASSRDR
ncbi:MAG: hypothetical protein ACJ77E_03225 [Gaiellaceae bacterium]